MLSLVASTQHVDTVPDTSAPRAPKSLDWQERGSCRKADRTLFYAPEREGPLHRQRREAAAKSICAGCPVSDLCREYALDHAEKYGVWGGLTERDRIVALGRRNRERAAAAS